MRHKIDMFMQEFEFHSIACHAVTAMLLFLALVITTQSIAAEEIDRELVDIKSVVPSIVVDLRYAGTHNAMHRALYPPSMPALIRPSVAKQLLAAQNLLRRYGYGL
jgi:D-alanyl-D-alanine dipeptidase